MPDRRAERSGERRCKRCGDVKPLTEMVPHPRSPDGRRSTCLACHGAQIREGYERKRQRLAAEAEAPPEPPPHATQERRSEPVAPAPVPLTPEEREPSTRATRAKDALARSVSYALARIEDMDIDALVRACARDLARAGVDSLAIDLDSGDYRYTTRTRDAGNIHEPLQPRRNRR